MSIAEGGTFSKEWVSIGDHRAVVWNRCGPPDDTVRRIATIVAWTLDGIAAECGDHSPARPARLVEVYRDDIYQGDVRVTIGTDDPESLEFYHCDQIARALGNVFPWEADYEISVMLVPEGSTQSDHYDRTKHIVESVMRGTGREVLKS